VPGSERILLVVDEAIDGDALGMAVLEQLGGCREAFVVAPALADSALKHQMGDVDEAIPAAAERLDRSLRWLREHGIDARGEVGDSDPLVAASDEVQKLGAERIVVIAHRPEEEAPAEAGLADRADRDLEQPLTELVVSRDGGEARVVEVIERSPGAKRGEGRGRSGNLPPMTPRDVLGIVVAIVGTLALGAVAAASDEPALLLLAMFMALINLAHVVGLVFFQSVRYTGPFETFFSRLSLFGTPAALLVAIVVFALT
jgi:hypothetical protein